MDRGEGRRGKPDADRPARGHRRSCHLPGFRCRRVRHRGEPPGGRGVDLQGPPARHRQDDLRLVHRVTEVKPQLGPS
jgi:hypothetical protein